MKFLKKIGSILMIAAILLAFSPMLNDGQAYAATIKLSKKTVYMLKGKTYRLRVKGTRAKVKWSSSDKTIVTVSKKGKLTAKGYGSATVTAKVKGKTLKCKVKVERKVEKNARTLRNYILKYGKKSGSKRYIKKTYKSDANEGTDWVCKITASSKDKNLVFYYSRDTCEPPAFNSLTMKIDLITGSASVRTGDMESYYEDGYGDNTWEMHFAEATTKFTGDEEGTGITITKYIDSYDETSSEETDPSVLNTETNLRMMSYRMQSAFKYWDKLMASKSTLKKAKITMKTIGFSKATY